MIMNMTTMTKSITTVTKTESSFCAGEGHTASIPPQVSAILPTTFSASQILIQLCHALRSADRRDFFPVFFHNCSRVCRLAFDADTFVLRCFEFEDSYSRRFVALEFFDDNFAQYFQGKLFGETIIPKCALLGCQKKDFGAYLLVELSLDIFGVRSNNQGFLVGVELNPGPDGRLPALLIALRQIGDMPVHLRTDDVVLHLQRLVNDFNSSQNGAEAPVPQIPPVKYLLEWGFLSERGVTFMRENFHRPVEDYMGDIGFLYGAYLRTEVFTHRPLSPEDFTRAGSLIGNFTINVGYEMEFVHFLRANNMGFLVGIEPNPGPSLFPNFLVMLSTPFFPLSADEWSIYRAVLCLIFAVALYSLMDCFIKTVDQMLFSVFIFQVALWSAAVHAWIWYNLDQANNQGYLVGIEPNPGPHMKTAYLRAQEKASLVVTPPRASAHKRGGGHDKQVRKFQWITKTLIRAQHKRNSIEKRLVYEPEALLEAGLDTETKDFLKGLLENFKNILSTGVNVNVDFTTSIVENVRRLLDSAKKHFVFVYDLIKFIFGILYAIVDEKVKLAFGMFVDLFTFTSESLFDTAVLLGLYKSTLGKHLGESDVLGVLRTLRNFKKDSESVGSIRSFFMSLLQTIISNLNVWLGTGIPVPTGNAHLDGFWTRFRAIKDELGKEDVIQSELAIAMYSLNKDVEDYYRSSTESYERDQARFLLSQIKPKVEYCETTINPNNGPRIEPLSIMIAGPSGVGKSTFAMPSLLALSARVLPKESRDNFMRNHNDLIFFRAPENEYWDGLKASHQIIVFDEFGQMKDVAGSTNSEAFEWIRLKNIAPYHLHYASISDKQRNYAVPKVIAGVTNRNEFQFNSLISNEAVIRRIDIGVCQVPKLEYCKQGTNTTEPWTRRLDMDKVRALHPVVDGDVFSIYVTSVMEFIEWDFKTGHPKVGGRTMDYDEFIECCVSKYKSIHEKGDSLLKFHQAMKEKYVPEGGLSTDSLESEDLEFLDAVEKQPEYWNKLYGAMRDRYLHYKEPAQVLGASCLKVAKQLCLFLGGLFALQKLWGVMFPSSEVESGPQEGKRKGLIRTKQTVKDRRAYARDLKMSLRRFQPESAVGEDGVVSVLQRNVYRLYCGESYVGTVLFIKGGVFCYPKHFDYQLLQHQEELGESDSDSLKVTIIPYFGGQGGFTFDWLATNPFTFDPVALGISTSVESEVDVCFAQLPKGYRDHRNISKWFAGESLLKDGSKFESVMAVLRGAANDPSKLSAVTCLLNPTASIGQHVCYLEDLYSYKLQYYAETEKGDCGSPLFSRDKRLGGPKILGVHTAGATNFFGKKHSAGVMLTREMVDIALEYFEDDSPLEDEEIVYDIPAFGADYSPEGMAVKRFPFVRKAIPPRRAFKSRIVHSPFYGKLWPLTTGTSRLTPFQKDGVLIDPAMKAKMKYCTPNVSIDETLLRRASKIVSTLVLAKTQVAPWKPRLFTFDEALNGVDGVEFVESINRTSSAGYPYVLEGSKGKKKWLGSEGKIDVNSPECKELEGIVNNVIDKASKGIRVEHIYMDCLKDERRPLEKVADGSTRQFMACPIQFLIAVRMYFGDFLRHINQNRVHNGVSIGIDPSSEWERLYVHLHPTPDYVHGAGDYKSFDCHLPSQVSMMFLEMCEAFYAPTSTETDVKIRRILFQDIINSIHIDEKGNVYEFSGKNPSGNPATADLNSVSNSIMLVCAWLSAGIPDVVVEREFRWTTGGDDHATGFPKEWVELAGSVSMAKELKKLFGYVYTDESKGQDLVPCKTMDEITFLKRSFKRVQGKMCAPLELSVILETLNWMRNTSDRSNFEQRINMALVELAQHGPQTFAKYSKKILELAHEHDFEVLYGTFDAAFSQAAVFSFE